MSQSAPRGNRILQALPPSEYRRIMDEVEPVTLPLGEVLARSGQPLRFACFPLTGVISAVVVLEDGSTVEGLTIGNEGMIGLGLLTGLEPKQFRFLVQVPGEVLRVRADRFGQIVAGSAAWADLLLRYAVVQINSGILNAACHRHHTVEERMCRWLLETSWRIGRDQFELTQEFLSELLGTRRQSVNLIARVLQRAGLIDYRRGEVTRSWTARASKPPPARASAPPTPPTTPRSPPGRARGDRGVSSEKVTDHGSESRRHPPDGQQHCSRDIAIRHAGESFGHLRWDRRPAFRAALLAGAKIVTTGPAAAASARTGS